MARKGVEFRGRSWSEAEAGLRPGRDLGETRVFHEYPRDSHAARLAGNELEVLKRRRHERDLLLTRGRPRAKCFRGPFLGLLGQDDRGVSDLNGGLPRGQAKLPANDQHHLEVGTTPTVSTRHTLPPADAGWPPARPSTIRAPQ